MAAKTGLPQTSKYLGISLNMKNLGNSVQPQGKSVDWVNRIIAISGSSYLCMLGSKSKSLVAATICKRCDVNILAAMPRETEPKGLSRG